eukprot:Skav208891  [mRNA]  locus=scaffold270:391588:392012:+ [translate_table: standard]
MPTTVAVGPLGFSCSASNAAEKAMLPAQALGLSCANFVFWNGFPAAGPGAAAAKGLTAAAGAAGATGAAGAGAESVVGAGEASGSGLRRL